ncbi:uncharacterized protein LOC117332084 [Pecten maximus]|uniref:uncharacterized protein LOC117332084 n=1 Tax=Pecten maximus TaxID=6579 RepID=UPI001458F2C5|nr:uncharacterized protein LOC117332084 [Pecten maximus]
MDLTDTRKVSRYLSQHLDRHPGVGSEKTVNIRRFVKYLLEKMYVISERFTSISTGSRSEGLDFASSDDDVMVIPDSVIIVQPHDEIPDRDASKTILVMDNTNCRPGYTLLRLLRSTFSMIAVIDSLTDFNGSKYLSSVLFSSNLLRHDHFLHGPCSTLPGERFGSEVDYAHCFHCRSWPYHLSDFSYRTKYCVWPSRHLVSYIVKGGCHVVAIGDKHSKLFAMQWRISFAPAEKSLVWSFNHVQLKTYALLKMFLKECIERDQSINELLCSYFMKTIVFHAIEHSTPSMWVDDNIVQCFWYCFTILLECVQTGYLPNYFVPTHNMFLSKVTGDNRRRLLHVLNRYQCMGYTCLFQCPSLQALPRIIQENQSTYPLAGEHLYIECKDDSFVVTNQAMYVDNCIDSATALRLIHKVFLKYSDDNILDIGLLFFIQAISHSSGNSIANLTHTHHNSNKTAYEKIRRHKRFLHLSSATDVCNGLLSLATFYYNVGSYTKASDVATRVVLSCHRTGLIQNHGNGLEYMAEMCGKGYTLLQKAKRSFVLPFIICKEGYNLYPPELQVEVQTNEYPIILPPLPYALFLLVLSTFRLGNIDQSQTILEDLMAVRNNRIYGVRHYPILHNLVGICHQLLGNTRQAILAFKKSYRQRPNPAAAIMIAAHCWT